MELLFDILLGLLQLLTELILPLLGEGALDFGLDRLKRRHWNTLFAMLGHALAGAIAGWLSLLLFPRLAIHDKDLQLLSLLLTPIACGLVISVIRHRWHGGANPSAGVRYFMCAWSFALTMGLLRYLYST